MATKVSNVSVGVFFETNSAQPRQTGKRGGRAPGCGPSSPRIFRAGVDGARIASPPVMRTPIPYTMAFWLATLLIGAAPAGAQIVVKANDDVNLKLGVLGQFQADTIDNPGTEPNTNNLFIRRLRLLFGGQVAKNVSFFVETDAPNLGKTLAGGKNIQPSLILQDAYGKFRVTDAFMLDAGLMFIPFSRNSLQSAATLLPIDYGMNTFNQSAPTESTTGRDTGFQARGYFVGNRLGTGSVPSRGFATRFQTMPSGTQDASIQRARRRERLLLHGNLSREEEDSCRRCRVRRAEGLSRLRRRRILRLSVRAWRRHRPIRLQPLRRWRHVDDAPETERRPARGRVPIEALKLTPVLQFAHRNITGGAVGDEKRTAVGANYWWAGHNVNVKALYTRIAPSGLGKQNEFTVQLQVFYF